MRVDTNKMWDAMHELNELRAMMSCTSEEIRSVLHYTIKHPVGGPAATAAIVAALTTQLKTLEKRMDNIQQLAQVLGSAADQYQICEERAKKPVGFIASIIPEGIIFRTYPPVTPVAPDFERKFIHQFIMPLMVAGKQGDK